MSPRFASRFVAFALMTTASLTLASAAPTEVPMDYDLGRFGDLAAWEAASSGTPMDYGLGAYASVDAWRNAGAAQPTTAVAQR